VTLIGFRRVGRPIWPRWTLLPPALTLSGLVGYGFYVELRSLATPEIEVRLEGLPAAFDGIRIVIVSDIHAGPHFGPDDMTRVVEAANAPRPDLVVLLGDFVARQPADVEIVVAGASKLRAPLGLYAVLGNHDYWLDPQRISEPLERAGIQLLRNRGTPIERNGARLWLAGLEDLRQGRPELSAAMTGAWEGDFTVVLAHNPMLIRQVEQRGLPLLLAGHTHGGQVQLPLIGALILPIPDHTLSEGLLKRGRSQIYVSRGVGVGTPPVRLGARPEVPLLVLRRA
jgi:predicted MPP superfamily phosphohydrolase